MIIFTSVFRPAVRVDSTNLTRKAEAVERGVPAFHVAVEQAAGSEEGRAQQEEPTCVEMISIVQECL